MKTADVTVEEAIAALDVALACVRITDEAYSKAAAVAFALALKVDAGHEVTYLLEVVAHDDEERRVPIFADWLGPEVLLRLAREKLLETQEGGDNE